MKKRYFVNGKSVMMAVSMVAALSVWGCGSNEGTALQSEDEIEGQTAAGDLEGTIDGAGDEENAGERKGEGKEEAGEGAQDVDETGNTAGIEGDRMEDGERIVMDGVIQKVEDGSFVMEQLMSEVDESTGLVMVGENPESPGVVVDYTEDTVFVRRVTTDGMTGKDEPGTEQDLGKDALVHVTGMWRGDSFSAEEISVFVDARK